MGQKICAPLCFAECVISSIINIIDIRYINAMVVIRSDESIKYPTIDLIAIPFSNEE